MVSVRRRVSVSHAHARAACACTCAPLRARAAPAHAPLCARAARRARPARGLARTRPPLVTHARACRNRSKYKFARKHATRYISLRRKAAKQEEVSEEVQEEEVEEEVQEDLLRCRLLGYPESTFGARRSCA